MHGLHRFRLNGGLGLSAQKTESTLRVMTERGWLSSGNLGCGAVPCAKALDGLRLPDANQALRRDGFSGAGFEISLKVARAIFRLDGDAGFQRGGQISFGRSNLARLMR